MKIVIDEKFDGVTVKSFLFGALGFSHAQVVKLKKENGILINGRPVFVTERLVRGCLLEVKIEDVQAGEGVVPSDIPIGILYEDDYLIAVNKPPFMPTHPSLNHYDDTLANALAHYFALNGRPFVFRAANRLDRDTGGVVLVAKDKHTSFLLAKMISRRLAEKEYLALLEGELDKSDGTIERNILRAGEGIMLRRTDDTEGAYARTDYRALEIKNGRTLVCAKPVTGRTHQLRVHFSSIGHPIVGDTLYGRPDEGIARQALHAYKLHIRHPVTGEEMHFSAPLPDDMLHLLKENGFETDF